MRKTLVGTFLLLVFLAGCDMVRVDLCPDPTLEEMGTCVRIARDWRSRIGRAEPDDWYNVQECSIDLGDDGKPPDVRIDIASSLGANDEQCTAFIDALRSAIESEVGSPAFINAAVVTAELTCGTGTFGFRGPDDS